MRKDDVYETITITSGFLFARPIHKIVYCYGQWQECFKDMTSQVTFVDGIPEDIPSMFPPRYRPGILVLDNLMRNCSDDERIVDLFTKVSHYCNVTCIYFWQNLFPPYIIAFNNHRDTLGFRTLAQQAFAGKVPYVLESFEDATSSPFGYLVMDLHPWTPNIQRLRKKYYRRHILIPRFTWTRKCIKQMNPCQLISVEIMTSNKLHCTAKRPRKNLRGGNTVLRSCKTTRLQRTTKKRPRISKHLLKGEATFTLPLYLF